MGTSLTLDGIEAGRYYHVTLVLDAVSELTGDAFMMYVNGLKVDSGLGCTMMGHGNPIALGGVGHETVLHTGLVGTEAVFDGMIDEFRVYNRVLTDDEIALLSGARDRQNWTLDALGNWTEFAAGKGQQTRAHNAANEITDIDGDTGVVEHDAAGNMTRIRRPDGSILYLVWVAWNRMTAVYSAPGEQEADLVARYEYDGAHQRIAKAVPTESGTFTRTDYYYNGNWQVLEEHREEVTTWTDVADELYAQNIYDLRYIDAIAVRDCDLGNGSFDPATGRVYYCHDALYSVQALVSQNGDLIEQYTYTPYGEATVLDASGETLPGSTVENPYAFTGRRLDEETGLMNYRNRYYDTGLGRFVGRDPIGYEGGLCSLYALTDGNPISSVDPWGLVEINITKEVERKNTQGNWLAKHYGAFNKYKRTESREP